eukprot:jgi/Ulvmu1/9828/UM056_0069.1
MPENKNAEPATDLATTNAHASPAVNSRPRDDKAAVTWAAPESRAGMPISPRQHGALNNQLGLTTKAAKKVKEGLPWPKDAPDAHDARRLAVESKVPWHTNVDISDSYELGLPLGTGGFAKVIKGKNKETGEDVAIKHITISEEGDEEVVYKEIKHLIMLLDVRQVVAIFEVFEHDNQFYIVMELCKGGELHTSFEDSSEGKSYTYGDVGRIAVCMLVLADAMHSRGLVHCDLKPENFCLAEPSTSGKPIMESLRLIDFGLSQRVRGGQAIAGLAGSIPYMAPEIKTRMYDHKVDIWSIGVIIYTLLNGTLPFDGRSAEEIMSRAATRKPDVAALHPVVADFVSWLLTKDPKKRPDARDALGHPWLKATGSKLALEGNDPYMQTISDEVARNLSKFAASNKLQRAFMHLAVTFIHKNEMQRMLAIFNKLNTDKHTPLPAEDITAILTKGRKPYEAQEIRETVEFVMGKDGALSIEDFIVATMNQYRNLSDQVIKTMFRVMDSDRDGWISAEDAFDALHPTGIHITKKELRRLFEKYGVKRRLGESHATSGIMTYHEFHELMMPSVSQRLTNDLDGVVSAFHNNREQTPFQKLVRRIVAENAPPTKEIERIKKAFHRLDKNKSATLTREELSLGVRQAGYVVSDDDLDRVFAELDTDGTGLVRYHEFVAGAIDHNILVGENLLRWVFDFMDDDDSNTITGDNLRNILEVVDWSKEEKAKIWEAALDNGGKYHDLSFEEFKALIQGEGGYNLVERMAAGAGAAHIERISGPQQAWDPPLARLMPDPSGTLPSVQASTALSSEPSRGELAAAALGAATSSDAMSVRWAAEPERQASSAVRGASGEVATDADGDDEGHESSDSEDETGKKKPALLSKRGEHSNDGALLRSPQRSAQLAMLAAAQAGAVDTTAPSALPRKRSASGAIPDADSAGLSGGSPGAVPPSPAASQSQHSACTAGGTASMGANGVGSVNQSETSSASKAELWRQPSRAQQPKRRLGSRIKSMFGRKNK